MGWRRDEVWLDAEVLWFREQPRQPFAALALELPAFATRSSRALRAGGDGARGVAGAAAQAQAARRRRLATRTVPAVALVLGSATMLPIAALRHGGGPGRRRPPGGSAEPDVPARRRPRSSCPRRRSARGRQAEAARAAEARADRASPGGRVAPAPRRSGSRTRAGSSTARSFPSRAPTGSTWNPNTDSVPNLPHRLYGNERTIRTIVSVDRRLPRRAPDAPRVVVGDISLRGGGRMDQHVSHQNGLDVDVVLPAARPAPERPDRDQPDRPRLAQDLLDRFVAAGAQIVFVGVLDRPPRPERRRRPVPEPREPHARPLPAARRLSRPGPDGAPGEVPGPSGNAATMSS